MAQLKLRAHQLDWRVIQGEIVALDRRTSCYLSVNGSGALLWKRLVEGSTRDDLVTALQAKYDLDDVRAGFDVDDFLTDMTGLDLIDED